MTCTRCGCDCRHDVSRLCAACYTAMGIDFDTTPPPHESARMQRIDAECVRMETTQRGT